MWLTETSLGVLGEAPSAVAEPAGTDGDAGGGPPAPEVVPPTGPQPWVITVGGRTTDLPGLADAGRITSTGGERNLVITSASSDLVYVRVGAQWLPAQDLGSEVIVAAR